MTAIQTDISPRHPTHVVSYWQNGHRAIVAVEAENDRQAIARATELAGEASNLIGLSDARRLAAYNVAEIGL